MWHWSQQIHHRMKWVVWGYTTNGCKAEIPTTCQAQSGSQTGIARSPMQPQMFIILGIWYMVLGFTSKAAQLWGDPSLIHTLWTPWCWVAHLHTIGCTPKSPKAPLARKLIYVEITIASLQKWEAKQVTGDVLPKITCCQPLADMSSISCTKTTRKGACCTGIWIGSCTGENLLTRTTD
jgi:hypothetical protein